MKPEEFAKRATKYAWRRCGNEQEAKDFGQWATIFYIRGRKARINQLYVDYLRTNIADSRTKHFELARALSNPVEYKDEINTKSAEHDTIQRRGDFIRVVQKLEPNSQAIIKLYTIWGLNEREIADCFGVTESRISQRIKALLPRIQKIVQLHFSGEKTTKSNTTRTNKNKREITEREVDGKTAERTKDLPANLSIGYIINAIRAGENRSKELISTCSRMYFSNYESS